jgi:hypothetical protein
MKSIKSFIAAAVPLDARYNQLVRRALRGISKTRNGSHAASQFEKLEGFWRRPSVGVAEVWHLCEASNLATPIVASSAVSSLQDRHWDSITSCRPLTARCRANRAVLRCSDMNHLWRRGRPATRDKCATSGGSRLSYMDHFLTLTSIRGIHSK